MNLAANGGVLVLQREHVFIVGQAIESVGYFQVLAARAFVPHHFRLDPELLSLVPIPLCDSFMVYHVPAPLVAMHLSTKVNIGS
ncbi:hypothetical protein [Bradyrhizobium sp. CCBAU 53340]|uniref:hypothetical protein n=1 Tax=Bradyrhizobium sp. CCBAU 53340 TaxID=1325112 RepID=UPI00188B11AC|nr:hypothetical protein [Bradyrhizobium sp. CCBAU 53340]